MKTFFHIREESSQLNEMEMLTHKKKIDAAKQKAIDLHHDFTKAAKHHFKQADAMAKKHGSDHPKTKMHRNIGQHMRQASDELKYHPKGIERALGRLFRRHHAGLVPRHDANRRPA
jgi:enoyl-CoA hydratase/carnithine racemase